MGVLHPTGVLGFVFRVSPNSAQIITLTHPLASLRVRNKRNRKLALLFSSLGQTQLYFQEEGDKNLEKKRESFKKGDVLITAESHQFPSGLFVGKVESLSEASHQTQVFIETFVNFESLEELFILLEPFESPFPVKSE